MMTADTTAVRIEIHGRVPEGTRELAAAKVGTLLRIAAEPVLSAHVTLTVAADPAFACPAVAQATVDMNGHIVRAQAAEQTMRAAVEQMEARLRIRLDRAARNWAALRGTVPTSEPGEWRHQSIPDHRPPYFPRPARNAKWCSAPATRRAPPARGTRPLRPFCQCPSSSTPPARTRRRPSPP